MNLKKDKWERVRLEKLNHDIEYGITASAEESGNAILLRITDINENGKLNNELKYTNVDEKTFRRYELKKNDVLIARSGATAGKPYIHKTNGNFLILQILILS